MLASQPKSLPSNVEVILWANQFAHTLWANQFAHTLWANQFAHTLGDHASVPANVIITAVRQAPLAFSEPT
jgi:hypothetical protein